MLYLRATSRSRPRLSRLRSFSSVSRMTKRNVATITDTKNATKQTQQARQFQNDLHYFKRTKQTVSDEVAGSRVLDRTKVECMVEKMHHSFLGARRLTPEDAWQAVNPKGVTMEFCSKRLEVHYNHTNGTLPPAILTYMKLHQPEHILTHLALGLIRLADQGDDPEDPSATLVCGTPKTIKERLRDIAFTEDAAGKVEFVANIGGTYGLVWQCPDEGPKLMRIGKGVSFQASGGLKQRKKQHDRDANTQTFFISKGRLHTHFPSKKLYEENSLHFEAYFGHFIDFYENIEWLPLACFQLRDVVIHKNLVPHHENREGVLPLFLHNQSMMDLTAAQIRQDSKLLTRKLLSNVGFGLETYFESMLLVGDSISDSPGWEQHRSHIQSRESANRMTEIKDIEERSTIWSWILSRCWWK